MTVVTVTLTDCHMLYIIISSFNFIQYNNINITYNYLHVHVRTCIA